jgi:hypothetical protein
MPARFWELSAGCIVFVALNNAPRFVTPLVKQIPSLVVLLSLATALFVPAQHSVYTTIAVVLLTALLIASVRPQTVGIVFWRIQPHCMWVVFPTHSTFGTGPFWLLAGGLSVYIGGRFPCKGG